MRQINNVLVTGGSGFIGWNFCNLLLQDTQFNIINIESWFEKSKCLNIYNKKSLMYILRNINDPAMFFNIDYENVDEEYLSNNYFLNIFPCGIINFFIDQHSMSFNMENVVPLSI